MFKNIIKLLTGNALAQALVFLSLPLITRLYSPESYGLYASIVALITILTVLGTLKLEFAIIVKAKSLIKHLLGFLLYWNVFIWLIFALLFFIYTNYIQLQSYHTFFLLLFCTLSSSIFFILSAFLNRNEKYGLMGTSKLLQSCVIVIMQIGLGLLVPTTDALLFAFGLSFMVASLVIFFLNRSEIDFNFSASYKLKYILTCKDYLLFQAPASIVNALTQNSFIFFIIFFYGAAVGGVYALAHRLLLAPSALIGKSIREVFVKKANEYKNDREKLKKIFVSTTNKLLKLSLPLYSFAAIFAYILFPQIFGGDWDGVAVVFPILCFWGVLLFVNSPSTAMIYVLELQKFSLIYEVLSILIRLLSSLLIHYLFDCYIYTIFCFSIISALSNGFYIYYVYKKI